MRWCVCFIFFLFAYINYTDTQKAKLTMTVYEEGNDTKSTRQFAREIIGGDWPRKLLPLWDVVMKLAIMIF